MRFDDAAARWNQRYQRADGALFGEEPNDWLARHCDLLAAPARVLCVADGQGRNSLHLARLGHQVTAFDISDIAVESLRQRARAEGLAVEATVCALADWPWPPSAYDAIVIVYTQFADPQARARMFKCAQQALRPGGLLIIEGFGPRQLGYSSGGPGVIENLYKTGLLAAQFARFTIVASRDCDVDLKEGRGHCGRAHVVSAVLRRPDDV